jgi:hypothetical protein
MNNKYNNFLPGTIRNEIDASEVAVVVKLTPFPRMPLAKRRVFPRPLKPVPVIIIFDSS